LPAGNELPISRTGSCEYANPVTKIKKDTIKYFIMIFFKFQDN
jgi:hypothetical protein